MSKPLDPKAAIFYGSFVQAAYSMFRAGDTNLRPDPAGHGVPDGWDVVAWITMDDFFLGRPFEKFYGILAQEKTDSNSFVLAMRGTEGAIEWYNNANAFLVPFDRAEGAGYVHKGFLRIYDTIKVTPRPLGPAAVPAEAAVAAAVPAQPVGTFADQIAQVVGARSAGAQAAARALDGLPTDANVVVVAHSLGAALCTLYVVDNLKKRAIQNPLVCTFASPRVGDQTFVDTFNGFGLTSWRIVNAQDIVPNVPPDVWSYRHVDALSLFDSFDKVQPTAGCAHAMPTYFHLLDASQPLDPECTVTEEESQRLREQLPDPAMAEQEQNAIAGVHSGEA